MVSSQWLCTYLGTFHAQHGCSFIDPPSGRCRGGELPRDLTACVSVLYFGKTPLYTQARLSGGCRLRRFSALCAFDRAPIVGGGAGKAGSGGGRPVARRLEPHVLSCFAKGRIAVSNDCPLRPFPAVCTNCIERARGYEVLLSPCLAAMAAGGPPVQRPSAFITPSLYQTLVT